MRRQNEGPLVGQASLYKLWNTPKNETPHSDIPTDENNEARARATSQDESTLERASGSSSKARGREGRRPPQNTGGPNTGRARNEEPSRKSRSRRETNNTKSKLSGSQTNLADMFKPKSKLAQLSQSQQPEGTNNTSGESDSSDNRHSSSERQLKRNHSAPLRSLPTPLDPIPLLPLSQPITSKPTVIEIDGEVSDHPSSVPNGSREAPIAVDLSPQRASRSLKHAKPFMPPPSSFFAPRRNLKSSAKLRTIGEGSRAAYPIRPEEQHVRGPQRSFYRASPVLTTSSGGPHDRKEEEVLTSDLSHLKIQDRDSKLDDVAYSVEPLGSQEGSHAVGDSILASHEAHPAFAKFLCPDHDIVGLFWNERWHPRCAAEVLGNSKHAFFLRDWLLALEIRDIDENLVGSNSSSMTPKGNSMLQKRPAIIRSVAKPRKRRRVDSDDEDLDGWMVSDDENETNGQEDDEDEDDVMDLRFTTPVFDHEDTCGEDVSGGSPWKPKRTRITRRRPPDSARSISSMKEETSFQTPVHDFSERLSNCILLAGPTGVGKTATVYACAEELGWEIFEVYPGIGKRNGSSLLSLVGDVTKNHIVKGSTPMTQETRSRAGKVANFFRSTSQGVKEDFGREADVFDPSADDATLRPEGVRQSIILLEEVDVLFSEDGGFWQTVVTLIRESRRPIVMTCNDPTLVPVANLPLQDVLKFEPASMNDASAYLQCMMLSTGYTSSIQHMRALYRADGNTEALDAGDTLLRAHIPSADVSPPDLRQAINNLQFLCQAVPGFDYAIPAPPHAEVAEELIAGTLRLEEAFDDFEGSISERSASDARSEKGRPSLQKLWRISEALSAVESQLGRSPRMILKTHSLGNEVGGDKELGYIRLEPVSEDVHHQDGIVFFNCDDAITIEACETVKKLIGAVTNSTRLGRTSAHHAETRAQPKGHGFLYDRGVHMMRTLSLMNKLVSDPLRQSLDSLFLDYEPWMRVIDRSDSEQERISVGKAEMRAASNGGRMTRNSNRTAYVRYFDLDDEKRREWEASGLEPMMACQELSV